MTSLDESSSIEEIAGVVSAALTAAGITAVLSGGAAVQIYSSGLYVSRDLDFVSPAGHRDIESVLASLGFVRQGGRHFVHPSCPYTLEFPAWPLAVGRQIVRSWATLQVGSLSLQILTPTQCVMDRLAAFYHWRDRQALDQAVAVARAQCVDLDEIRRWSSTEGRALEHEEFVRAVRPPEPTAPE